MYVSIRTLQSSMFDPRVLLAGCSVIRSIGLGLSLLIATGAACRCRRRWRLLYIKVISVGGITVMVNPLLTYLPS